MFIHTNQPLITSFYMKKNYFCKISYESALICNFLRNGRVRVKILLKTYLQKGVYLLKHFENCDYNKFEYKQNKVLEKNKEVV